MNGSSLVRRIACTHEGFGAPPPGYVPGVGRGMVLKSNAIGAALDGGSKRERVFSHYDNEDEGAENPLLLPSTYTEDDKIADSQWDKVDAVLANRSKSAQREAKRRAVAFEADSDRVKVYATFSDLKEQLKSVSHSAWMSIPDIGNNALRYKEREQRFRPAPDSLLQSARDQAAFNSTVDEGVADLNQVGEARQQVLSLKLKEMDGDASKNVDSDGYMHQLDAQKVLSADELGDIEKTRELLSTVIKSSPHHPKGYIGLARLEQAVGKLTLAREYIDRGCKLCPDSVDIWLEASRLHNPAQARTVLARALQHLPNEVELWMRAAALESDDVKRHRRVLRKALEHVPDSEALWKATVQLETPDEARILLGRAVECCPTSLSLWLALARMEPYEKARTVLNTARKHLPKEPRVWLTAAKLEEANGNTDQLDKIVTRAIKSLEQNGVTLTRAQWLLQAEAAERGESPRTAHAIVRAVERHPDDIDTFIDHKAWECARASLAQELAANPSDPELWQRVAELECEQPSPPAAFSVLLNSGPMETKSSQDASRSVLDRALECGVAHCPHDQGLWLRWAKDRVVNGNMIGAREVLTQALTVNPDAEHVWCAAVKMERDHGNVDQARSLLVQARREANTPRVWIKAALLERDLKNVEAEGAILDAALDIFGQDEDSDKLWMMRAQWAARQGQDARPVFDKGLRAVPESVPLWLCLARYEAGRQRFAQARAVLEKARVRIPRNDVLWMAAVSVELAAGQEQIAGSLLSKGLQEVPDSGLLWAASIGLAPRNQRRAKSVDAVKRCEEDAHVALAVGKYYWSEHALAKARVWLQRAVTLDPTLGDAWAHLYKFEQQHAEEEEREGSLARIEEACVRADARYGELWTSVSKDPDNFAMTTTEILKAAASRVNVLFV